MEAIERIIKGSDGEFYVRGRKTYRISRPFKNPLYVNLWQDQEGVYLGGLQYIEEGGFFWTWGNDKDFVKDYLDESNSLRFEVHSFRKYGEPKLSKPKELKGVKQSFSVDYIPKKARCSVFIDDNDVWVKHVDYFSESLSVPEEESGAPLEYLANKYLGKQRNKKFIYGDAWGSIVLRNEAWLRLRNLIRWTEKEGVLSVLDELLRQQERLHGMSEYELSPSDMERFLENVINEAMKEKEAK